MFVYNRKAASSIGATFVVAHKPIVVLVLTRACTSTSAIVAVLSTFSMSLVIATTAVICIATIATTILLILIIMIPCCYLLDRVPL
jgi:hypothetical protein